LVTFAISISAVLPTNHDLAKEAKTVDETKNEATRKHNAERFSTCTMTITKATFLEEGKAIFRGRRKISRHHRTLHTDLGMFRAYFGTHPSICMNLWSRIRPFETVHPKSEVKHLLWTLFFMHNYAKENVNASFCGVDEDTFRKWTMPWIPAISNLSSELLDFDNRFEGSWHYWTFCVDGVHCPIQEPGLPFWRGWWSHKFKGAGLAYEIATAVTTGKIIWVNGPFPAGKWPDHKIFKHDLANHVMTGIEKGVCDAGYFHCDQWLFRPPWRTKAGIKKNLPRNDLHDYIRARHEQTNGRITKWNCLSTPFRHDRELHQACFYAIVVIVQLEIMAGLAPQFDVVPEPGPFIPPNPAEQYEATPNPEEAYPPLRSIK
jgi:hypothetical protein